MTREQVKLLASILHELALAALVGALGDLAITQSRFLVDGGGAILGTVFLAGSYLLTKKLGGPRIWL